MVMVNLCINWCWWGNANCTWCLLWNWNSSQYPSLPLTSNNGWIKCSGWCIMKWKLSQMIESPWSVQWKIENLKNLIQLLSVPVICDILGISEGCTVDVLGMSYHIMPYHQQYILHMTQCQDEFRILSGRTQKLKVAKRCWKKWNKHILMYIYHK